VKGLVGGRVGGMGRGGGERRRTERGEGKRKGVSRGGGGGEGGKGRGGSGREIEGGESLLGDCLSHPQRERDLGVKHKEEGMESGSAPPVLY